ncbi:MAG: sodium-dependent transporter [Clostridia bacterium]|nr:sodium-dependent transporter [Clostridia bacterium]
MQREHLSSRLGFILLSAGCAIGVGNVWKFPYLVGENGGGIFVLIYLVFLAIMGVPVMTMEFAMGRASQKSPVRMYNELVPGQKKWRAHGYVCLAGNVLLMMFYTSVSGWMLQYFYYMVSGKFENMTSSEQISGVYGEMLSEPGILLVFLAIVIVIGFGVCALGLQKGIEKVTKVMMLALLAIMIVLVFNSLFLDGGLEGVRYYLVPDFAKMREAGIVRVITNAMNQAFFTLSIGMGGMAIFGSYIDKKRSLMGEAVSVAALDTFVAFCSGLIIIPACSAFGVSYTAGPPLIFQTLPNIFANMWGGRVFGSLFFVFMSFAALSTVLGVFENILASLQDMLSWSRKKICLIGGIAMFILSVPCVLGFNLLKGFQPLGAGSDILGLEDFIVSNIILPLGSLLFVLFCTNKRFWGWDKFVAEANQGKGLKVVNWMRIYMKYVLPVIILALFVLGMIFYWI